MVIKKSSKRAKIQKIPRKHLGRSVNQALKVKDSLASANDRIQTASISVLSAEAAFLDLFRPNGTN
jgi:hypothetical protein